MTIELVKALLYIAKVCVSQSSCEECPMKEFCMKQPSSWQSRTGAVHGFEFPRIELSRVFRFTSHFVD